MSTKSNALNTQIAALIKSGAADDAIVAETGAKKGIVKAIRLNINAEKQQAELDAKKELVVNAELVKPEEAKTAEKPAAKPMNKMEEMAAKAKLAAEAKVAKQATADADIVAPTAPKATRTRADKVTKDLTKRDVVAIVSDSAKIVYICTTLKYSGVGAERAKTLLVKDLEVRANQKPKNEQGIRDLIAAEDMTCLLTLVQGEASAAQVNKLKTHMSYEQQGYLMLSTKGRGAEVKAALAKIAAEATEAPVTVAA